MLHKCAAGFKNKEMDSRFRMCFQMNTLFIPAYHFTHVQKKPALLSLELNITCLLLNSLSPLFTQESTKEKTKFS